MIFRDRTEAGKYLATKLLRVTKTGRTCFKRFPTWMWRNTVVLDFVEWLREHNASLPLTAPKVGFYLNTRCAT